tara:strand:- start:25 stop:1077 length:1053 start_codon:yes stop_codon:yes gene_type:complete
MKIAINGLGRIGSGFLRSLYSEKQEDKFTVVAIKDYLPGVSEKDLAKNLTYLLQNDSIYGRFPGKVEWEDNCIIINNLSIPVINSCSSLDINWDNYGTQILIEASGDLSNIEDSNKIISKNQNLNKIIITRNAQIADKTIIFGVNETSYHEQSDNVLSLSTCTGNAIAGLVEFIDKNFIIKNGSLSTIHPVLSSEKLLDNKNMDFNIGRAAKNIKVTNTGVVKSLQVLFPHLKGKFIENAISFRIPTDIVSIVQATINTESKLEINELKSKLEETFSDKDVPGMRLSYGNLGFPLVATDFIGNSSSAILDMLSLDVNDNMLSAFVWHDNEMGYAYRILDCLNLINGNTKS